MLMTINKTAMCNKEEEKYWANQKQQQHLFWQALKRAHNVVTKGATSLFMNFEIIG